MHAFPLPANICHPAPSPPDMGTGELALLWALTQIFPVAEMPLASFLSLLLQLRLQQPQAS